jgi:hypothetical protein
MEECGREEHLEGAREGREVRRDFFSWISTYAYHAPPKMVSAIPRAFVEEMERLKSVTVEKINSVATREEDLSAESLILRGCVVLRSSPSMLA